MGDFVTIAKVVKTQGRVGEVAVELFTDFPERFAERRRLFLLEQNGSRRELHLEDFWPHKERLILKFHGVDCITDAEALLGAEVQIPKDERAALEQGAAYVSDLVGCAVFVRARPTTADLRSTTHEVGKVTDVTFDAGEAPVLEVKEGGKELLIPLAQEYIKLLDTAGKRIELELPEGMLELDAPLSGEEKQAQKDGN